MNSFWNKYNKYYKQILVIGFPILLGQLGIIITGFVDTLMVGQYSTEALAASAFVNSLLGMMNVVCMGFSYGITPVVGALFGRGETHQIGETIKVGLVINIIFGLICSLIMLIAYIFIDEMGQPVEILPLIRPYYIVILISMIPVIIVNVFRQFTDAITDTKLAMIIILVANALNILGNWLLIYGNWGFPEWGLYGAGISTMIARFIILIAYIICLLVIARYRTYLRGFFDGIVTKAKIKQLTKISLPISIQMGMEAAIFTLAAIIVGWFGADSLAAFQVILSFGTIGFMIYYSLGASLSIIIANYSGTNDIAQVHRCSIAGYHIILSSAILASIIVLLGGEMVFSLLTNDAKVIDIAVTLIIPWILYQFGDATQITYANALRGIKCVMPMMKYAFISYVVVGTSSAFLFAFTFNGGVKGVILSFAVTLFVAGALFTRRFYKEIATTSKVAN